uniref:Reverse transcriptase n=1 Tax=Peronospora matthiolae TaxID=2874970 RepID=A0AAV1VNU8_9STRA
MRFWWPDWHSERSPSSDSECSTDDHSSLASDGSFYDASSDAETGVDFDQSPSSILDDTQLVIGDRTAVNLMRPFPERSAVPFPLEVGPYGMGRADVGQAHPGIFGAPVFGPADGENGPRTPPRATPPPAAVTAELNAATSGTCSEHASPLALQMPARGDVSGARAKARSPVPTLGTVEDRGEARRHPVGTGEGTFGPILGLSIGVAVASRNAQQHARMATDQDGAACVGPFGASSTPLAASSARRLASPASPDAPAAAVASQDEDAIVGIPGRAGVTLPDRVSPTHGQGLQSDGSPGASMRRPGTKTCTKGIYTLRSALPDVGAAHDTTIDAAGPGRAASMLPDRVQHGHLQSIGSPGAHRHPTGPDACATGPPALPLAPEAPAAARDPAIVAPPPGRAARMLPDRVQLGSALVAATARAMGAFQGPSDPEDSESSDGGPPDDDTASSMDDDAATSSNDDDRLEHVATELPSRAGYTAVATALPMGMHDASHEAVSTAASVYVPCLQVCDDQLGGQAPMQPDRAGYASSLPHGSATLDFDAQFLQDEESKRGEDDGRQGPLPSCSTACNRSTGPCAGCVRTAGLSPTNRPPWHLLRGPLPQRSVLRAPAARAPPGSSPKLYRSRPVCAVSHEEVVLPPTGPLFAVASAAAAAASSRTVAADVDHQQSAVPTTPASAGHQHVPPMWCPSLSQREVRVAGKRRRLDDLEAAFPDLDELMDDASVDLAHCWVAMKTCTARISCLQLGYGTIDSMGASSSFSGRSSHHYAADWCAYNPGSGSATTADSRCIRYSCHAVGATSLRDRGRGGCPPCHWRDDCSSAHCPAFTASCTLTSDDTVTAAEGAPAPVRTAPPPTPAPRPASPSPSVEATAGVAETEPWLLRFDGACRQNPGPGGRCSETNNTAEYTALLVGVQSAVHHGATRLLVEGDSNLVLAQVRGSLGCNNRRLRRLRGQVRTELARLDWHQLRHIDRSANAHADRLANRALDLRRTAVECGPHSSVMDSCFILASSPPAATPVEPGNPADDSGVDDMLVDTVSLDIEADIAARDGGEVFPTLPIGPDSSPARQPRLRLRPLTEAEHDSAAAAVQRFAEVMACKIVDADSWITGEGYIYAIPDRLREVLLPYTVVSASYARPRATPPRQRRRRPPRVTHTQREHRLDEALDDMQTTQHTNPGNSQAVQKARRRVGRIRASIAQLDLRRAFATDETTCVGKISDGASAETAGVEHPDTCPIGREELHRHFVGTSTAPAPFNYDAAVGLEDQLRRAAKASSPGHDGVGYDVYRRFALQLVPLLHAAYQFCWLHRMVPSLWKVGIVCLIHKKGDPMQPTNWRPICLQPAIYKLYSGLLARRLSRWLELNNRLPMAQKGFRAFNGCHEHNFAATTMLDQSRRSHRKLYQVWYDLRNAFGSLTQALMWQVLCRLGVEPRFISRCQDIYDGSAFVVVNAKDGATDPVRQEVGVYQGCPLSPLLFIAALVPLVRRLEQLEDVGVSLADGVRPCTTAYADDIKVFSNSATGIQRCHGVVTRFLAWTGLRANTAKCASLAVTTNARGNLALDDSVRLELHGDIISSLALNESYRYLGVGDGFDHVQHRLQLEPKLKQIKREAVALMQSSLAEWQVVKALKTYVYPKVEYDLRHLRPLHSQLQGFDCTVKRGLRHLLRLPQSATTEFFYTPTSGGGLGLQSLVEMHQALQVAHAWQMLHSKDPAIMAVAQAQVCQVLASSPHAIANRRSGDIASLWVDVQRVLCVHQLKFSDTTAESGQDRLALRVPHHDKWLDHKTVLRHVKLHMKIRHQTRWKSLADQGNTARVHGGPRSKFVMSGAGLSDAEHRFGIQARLNQVDTNSVLKRRRLRANARCRKPNCSSAETLAHVLNHCAPNMGAIRQRHDSALEQIGAKIRQALVRTKSGAELRLNQTVPEYTGAALRPDIVLRDVAAKTLFIADLAVTFENHAAGARHSSLHSSHDFKVLKYKPIADEMRLKGWRVQSAALNYGTLGSVYPSNFKTYTEMLHLLKREARQLDLQLSSHCIRSGHRIWSGHCRLHRDLQRSGGASGAPRGSGGTPRSRSRTQVRR